MLYIDSFKKRKDTLIKLAVSMIMLLLSLLFAFHIAPKAYAAQASVSNVSGSLHTYNVGCTEADVDWSFSFAVASASVGDYVDVTTANVTFLDGMPVTLDSGEEIGKLQQISHTTDGNNSIMSWRTYRITFTKNLSNAHVTVSGHVLNGFLYFVHDGGHDHESYIRVNGATAATEWVHYPGGSLGTNETRAYIINEYLNAQYRDGDIPPYALLAHVESAYDDQLHVGDRIIYHSHNSANFPWSLSGNYQLNTPYKMGMIYDVHRFPPHVGRNDYGAVVEPLVDWWVKIISVSPDEAVFEITQEGTHGMGFAIDGTVLVNITPKNSSTINYDVPQTWPYDITSRIVRDGYDKHYRTEEMITRIQTQEVLSDASFYTQVNTSVTNGSITPSVQAAQGTNIRIDYTPNTGYELESITVDGSSVSTSAYPSSYTFTNSTGTHSINVKYKIKTFSLTSSVTNGTITPGAVVNYGTSKTFSYSPNNGYLLQSVVVDGTPVNIANYPNSYTFSNVQANHSINVTYAAPTASKTYR